MRTIAILGCLLLAACAPKTPEPQKAEETAQTPELATPDPDKPPPLCGTVADADEVRIDIDLSAPAGQQVNPKDCTVKKYTKVWWWEAGGDEFESKFETGTPADNGEKNFKSKKVKEVHITGFKAKHVDFKTDPFKYHVYIGDKELDPAIIVDP